MEIRENHVVTFHYVLTDENGAVIQNSRESVPLVYVAGTGSIIEGLEEAMMGKKEKDVFSVKVDPGKGYGLRDESRVVQVDTQRLKANLPNARVGDQIMMNQGGQGLPVQIKEIGEETSLLDANHPLAGQHLNFAIEVLGVRKASSEELAALNHHHHGEEGCCGGHGHSHEDGSECCGGHGH